MPLDREFGINMDFVDMPPEVAKSLYTAEITKKTAQFIPEVRVQSVQWTPWRRGRILSQGGDHKCLTCQQSRTHRKSVLLTIRRWKMCAAKWWPIMRNT